MYINNVLKTETRSLPMGEDQGRAYERNSK